MARRIDPEFGPYDGVLFLALWWVGGRVCTLADIIVWYDFVNRDIPTVEILDGGLNRLLATRLIKQRCGGFFIPPKVLREYETFRRRRRRDRFTMAEAFVRSASPLATVPRQVTVRRTAWQKAYDEYERRMQEAWEKVFGRS
jgi:hypothetical protein